MPVIAITPDYTGEVRDSAANFAPNILLYCDWRKHTLFVAPIAVVVSPEMPFSALFSETLTNAFHVHPDWEKVDPSQIIWELDGRPFTPRDQPLSSLGIGHKSFLRFTTPGLNGIGGVAF